jgi:hypothetical protein
MDKLQRACLALLREHEADGALPTSGRFLWYELVQRGVVDKSQSRGHPGVRRGVDQDVSEALTRLREAGLVPWWWIADETRRAYKYVGHRSVREGLLDSLDSVHLNPWGDAKGPVVLCESRSLAGVLDSVAEEYGCSIASTNGQCGGFLHTNVVPLLDGRRPVLYLGDLDLAGDQIEANTRKVLSGTWRRDDERFYVTDWQRIALTDTQVDEHGLRPLAITKRDRRYRDSRPHQAIETEALSQRVLVDILRGELDRLVPEPLDDVEVREDRERDALRAVLDSLDEEE